MPSGEGNENGEKITIGIKGVISKKATLHMQHTFLYISLPLFCTTTTWNFRGCLYTEPGQFVAFLPFSRPVSPMTIKQRVLVAIMEGKLELGLGFG